MAWTFLTLAVAPALALILLAATFGSAAGQQSEADLDTRRLHALFEEEWEWRMRDSPTLATYVGDPRYDDRWQDLSWEAVEARRAHARELLERISAIDRASLPESERLNYDLFLHDAREAVEGQRFPRELLTLNQLDGVYSEPAQMAQVMPRATVADYENLLRRLERVPELVDQHVRLLERGVDARVTPPRIVLRDVGQLVQNQIVDDPRRHPVYRIAFEEMPPSIPDLERERLRKAARRVLAQRVVPAYRRLHEFVTERYLPAARESIAAVDLPDGEAWYAFEVRRRTTTDLTPGEIHEIGLREVARIRGEMERVKTETGFEGDLPAFFEFLRTDPRFFHRDEEALLAEYRDIAKRVDPALPRLFGTLPRLPYGVVPVPEYSERTQTTAYYYPGSPQAGRPGLFYANTYDLPSRPKWEMEALTLHEAVPGHHLQIALAQELPDVPLFRRWLSDATAFVEGWGLYAESLGPELGMYGDPYARFGQLTYEMWRAIRLVVDTGMHAKGWSRERAIEYFLANAGKAEHDVVVEIDRYIAWPGQALAYKIGELRMKELRARAETELGERFDVRAFHDTLLGAGALPLFVLEARIEDWIARQASG
ncbi:MAG: DUF885 family protein [Gemmatimonadota bacterium]